MHCLPCCRAHLMIFQGGKKSRNGFPNGQMWGLSIPFFYGDYNYGLEILWSFTIEMKKKKGGGENIVGWDLWSVLLEFEEAYIASRLGCSGFCPAGFWKCPEIKFPQLSGQLVPVLNHCSYVVNMSSSSTVQCHLLMSGKRDRKLWWGVGFAVNSFRNKFWEREGLLLARSFSSSQRLCVSSLS